MQIRRIVAMMVKWAALHCRLTLLTDRGEPMCIKVERCIEPRRLGAKKCRRRKSRMTNVRAVALDEARTHMFCGPRRHFPLPTTHRVEVRSCCLHISILLPIHDATKQIIACIIRTLHCSTCGAIRFLSYTAAHHIQTSSMRNTP